MTIVRLPDLRDRPQPGHAVAGWYALSTDQVSVPTLDDARHCAETGIEHEPCTLRVTRFDPPDGTTIIASPVPDGTAYISIDIDVLPGVPPDTTPILKVRLLPGEDVLIEFVGVVGACATRVHFEAPVVYEYSFGHTYGLQLIFRGADGDIEPLGNRFQATLETNPEPLLPRDPCAVTLVGRTQVVVPVMDPPLRRPPRPPLIAMTHDGCEVRAWSTHRRGLILAPAGTDGIDVFLSPCGGLAFHLDFPGADIRDAIFWGDEVAVLLADGVRRFDLWGCPNDGPFPDVPDGLALGISEDGALLVIVGGRSPAVRLFRMDGFEVQSPGAFDARGWYARHRSPAFVYDEGRCEYLLDASKVSTGCCVLSARVLDDAESIFFRYIDDLRTLRTRPAYARCGEVIFGPNDTDEPLDAGRPGTQWHRISLFGEIPAGCVVQLRTRATDDVLATDPLLPDGWSAPVEATPLSRVPIESPEDEREAAADMMVLASPGRFLELKLTLLGDGRSSPRIDSIEIERPREGISQYLPQVFRDSTPGDDFLRRWLAIFEQTTFRGVADRLDAYAELFDPHTAPEDFLEYVAGWLEILSLDRFKTDVDAFRRVLLHAPDLARTRGTPAGLELAVKLYMGVPIQVVEASRTGSDFVLGFGAAVEAAGCDAATGTVLGCQTILSREPSPIDLGDEPRLGCGFLLECDDRVGYFPWHFDVWVPARCVCRSEDLALLRYIIEVEKPAHTTYSIRETGAAGWVLGVESVVGQDRSAEFDGTVCDPGTFGITILNGPPRSPPLGVGLVLGRDSRLAGASGPAQFVLGETGARVGQTTRVGE